MKKSYQSQSVSQSRFGGSSVRSVRSCPLPHLETFGLVLLRICFTEGGGVKPILSNTKKNGSSKMRRSTTGCPKKNWAFVHF